MTWPTVPLGELADGKGALVDGPFGSNLKASEYEESGVPIIRLQNIRPNVYLSKDIKFVSPQKAAELSRHNYKAGDLVVAKLGDPCGMTCVIPETAASGVIVADVVRFRGRSVSHQFLSYYLNSPSGQAQFARRAKGATRQRVNLADIKEILVPVPPREEQERVVDLLSRAETIVRMRREAEVKAQEVIPALFLDMFGDPATNPRGWPMYQLGELVARSRYGPRFPDRDYASSGAHILRTTDMSFDGSLRWRDSPVLPVTREEIAKFSLQPGVLLVTRTGATIGKAAIFRGAEAPCIAGAYLIELWLKNSAEPDYVLELLRSKYGQTRLLTGSRAVAQPNLNAPTIKAIAVPVPPSDLQFEFAHRLKDVHSIADQQNMASEKSQEMFDALLAEVFRER